MHNFDLLVSCGSVPTWKHAIQLSNEVEKVTVTVETNFKPLPLLNSGGANSLSGVGRGLPLKNDRDSRGMSLVFLLSCFFFSLSFACIFLIIAKNN